MAVSFTVCAVICGHMLLALIVLKPAHASSSSNTSRPFSSNDSRLSIASTNVLSASASTSDFASSHSSSVRTVVHRVNSCLTVFHSFCLCFPLP
ncbi:hypothetical protein GYMLUDRAFT_33258 [Collybiopsis luxurians FD-317 M1]|nr:hypothetical protein GYMLUDRAFT_33258 [Collybiopsis luxurians FD-317 M1]